MTNVTCCPCDLAVRSEAFAWMRKLRTDVRGSAIEGSELRICLTIVQCVSRLVDEGLWAVQDDRKVS